MSSHSHDHTAVAPAEVLDPVCGMTIATDDAVGHIDHKGQHVLLLQPELSRPVPRHS